MACTDKITNEIIDFFKDLRQSHNLTAPFFYSWHLGPITPTIIIIWFRIEFSKLSITHYSIKSQSIHVLQVKMLIHSLNQPGYEYLLLHDKYYIQGYRFGIVLRNFHCIFFKICIYISYESSAEYLYLEANTAS